MSTTTNTFVFAAEPDPLDKPRKVLIQSQNAIASDLGTVLRNACLNPPQTPNLYHADNVRRPAGRLLIVNERIGGKPAQAWELACVVTTGTITPATWSIRWSI
jgi:hypothetical protein